MHEVAKLAVDLYKNRLTNYSKEEGMDVLRKELVEMNGGSDKITPKSFRKNPELFEILEQALDVLIVEGLEDQFNEFVETVQLDHGDTTVFTIEEHRLFDVAVISDGNGDLRRDRLDRGEVTVRTHTYGIAIYEELSRLLAGRVDWVKMVDNVAKSYTNKIRTEIYKALYESFDKVTGNYKVTGSFTEDKLATLIAHVEAGTGMDAMIMGTKQALAKITTANMSEQSKEARESLGYVGNFQGTDMVEVKQAHKPGTDQFAIDNDFLIVAPMNPDKMVKLVLEGDSMIMESQEGDRLDMQRDYKFIKKAGFAVISASKWGVYKFA